MTNSEMKKLLFTQQVEVMNSLIELHDMEHGPERDRRGQMHWALLAEIAFAHEVLEGRAAYPAPHVEGPAVTETGSSGLYEAARAIAQERADDLRQLRAALDEHNEQAALRIARKLCGIEVEDGNEARNRASSRIH